METESATGPTGRINWLEIGSAVFSGLGVAATIGWLIHPGHHLACIDSYLVPVHQPAIALSLLLIGGAMSLIAEATWVVVLARWLTGAAFGVALLVVVILPIVIHAVACMLLEWMVRNAHRRKGIWIPRSWAALRGLFVGALTLWLDWGITIC